MGGEKPFTASDLQNEAVRRMTTQVKMAKEKIKKRPYREAIKELRKLSTVTVSEKLNLIANVCHKVD